MAKNNIKRNSIKQIKKLKKDLMKERAYSFSTNHSNYSSKFSKEFKKIKNSEIGEIFESNIRKTLISEYNWKEGSIQRNLFLRKIRNDKTEEILLINEPKDIIIKNKKYTFCFNNDKSVTIIIKDTGEILKKIEDKKKTNLLIDEENIELGNYTEIEFDGSFEFNNYEFSNFNRDEVSTLFSNVNDTQLSSFNYIILEIKLNKYKISDLINQLKRDKEIVKKISNKKFLYVGFLNSKIIDIDVSSIIGDLNIIIFGLKNNTFASRDMRKFYDWDTIQNVKILKSDVVEIRNELTEIRNELAEMKNKMNLIDQKITLLLEKKN